ncbi:hypothetical protein [Candidatus Hodgkinia cicadicola]|uniref:hypothetical protein n=1 Tax=Candidatus Hodgkinia cicadicola TaxID=573658 RepID=UPI001788D12D
MERKKPLELILKWFLNVLNIIPNNTIVTDLINCKKYDIILRQEDITVNIHDPVVNKKSNNHFRKFGI